MDYFNQRSERLYYRALTLDDIPAWERFFHGNPAVRFLGIPAGLSELEIATLWIETSLERNQQQGLGYLAVHEIATDAFIGMVGILPRPDFEGWDEYEIDYSLLNEFQGKGYATEAAQQMRRFGEQQIDCRRFISIIHEENEPSKRVAERNGMSLLFSTDYKEMPVQVYGTGERSLK